MMFKLSFPTGCNDLDIHNDNVDVNIITEDNFVYFATLFTIKNLASLMEKNNSTWFWATNMIIVKDLEILTIKNVFEEIVNEGSLESIAFKIGNIESVFGTSDFYTRLKDWGNDADSVFFGVS